MPTDRPDRSTFKRLRKAALDAIPARPRLGEMAVQQGMALQASRSFPQTFVRLVGYRDARAVLSAPLALATAAKPPIG